MSEDGKNKDYGSSIECEEPANVAVEKPNGSTIGFDMVQFFFFFFLYLYFLFLNIYRIFPSLNSKFSYFGVKNLGADVTEEVLQDVVSKFGKIAAQAKEDNGTSRGFCFVNFDKSNDARQAMEA